MSLFSCSFLREKRALFPIHNAHGEVAAGEETQGTWHPRDLAPRETPGPHHWGRAWVSAAPRRGWHLRSPQPLGHGFASSSGCQNEASLEYRS